MALAVLVDDLLEGARGAVMGHHPTPNKLEMARPDESLHVVLPSGISSLKPVTKRRCVLPAKATQ